MRPGRTYMEEKIEMGMDRFGNPACTEPVRMRGQILASTADDFRKLRNAWQLIASEAPNSTFSSRALDHSLPMQQEDLAFADDELGAASTPSRLELPLESISAERRQAGRRSVFNRLTGATMATHFTSSNPAMP